MPHEHTAFSFSWMEQQYSRPGVSSGECTLFPSQVVLSAPSDSFPASTRSDAQAADPQGTLLSCLRFASASSHWCSLSVPRTAGSPGFPSRTEPGHSEAEGACLFPLSRGCLSCVAWYQCLKTIVSNTAFNFLLASDRKVNLLPITLFSQEQICVLLK